MESFSELIRLRRSMRKFSAEHVDADDARLLLRAGLMAPSSKGLHSWEFVVVEDAHAIEALSRCKAQGADFLAGAPMLVVVAGRPAVSDVWIEDASVASTMILLQAEDLGLGACWVQIRDRKDAEGGNAEDNVRRILGIPDSLRILSIIAVGHKGMERKPFNEDRLLWEKVHAYSPMIPLEF
ncbi:MAG: nitroreductase family protein [Bacteroidaceae bacterium]|nr:nitroreductase family protein [Bacteroidaceae bacterium]